MATKAKLTRQIGVLPLVIYYFSTIVGVGIFLIPLHAARIAGPASIISWILVLLMVYPFAMIFAHISQVYQVSGSIQKFLEHAAGFKFGKSMALFMTITAMFGTSLLGYTSARYIMDLIDYHNSDLTMVLGLGMLALSGIFNLINLGLSSRIQTITLIGLVIILESIVMASVPSFRVENVVPFMPNGLDSVFAAMLICFYSVVGWENVDAIAEEVKDPVRTYKKAIRLALIAISLCYLSIAFTVIMVIPTEQLQGNNTIVTALLTNSLGYYAGKIGSILAIILLFLAMNVWIMGTSRIIFALARDNVLPGFLADVSKNNIPQRAVVSQLIFYALVSLIMLVVQVSEDTILELAGLNYLILYIIIFFCGIKQFTTLRLKMLAGFSLIVSALLLQYSSNHIFGISTALLVLCFVYVYLQKRSKVHTLPIVNAKGRN
jgi:amino acid efflux transporter